MVGGNGDALLHLLCLSPVQPPRLLPLASRATRNVILAVILTPCLTPIHTRYNHLVYFPLQVKRRDELLRAVTMFWETYVRSKLESVFERYVVDFAVLKTGRVIVIELNPFDTFTGEEQYYQPHART